MALREFETICIPMPRFPQNNLKTEKKSSRSNSFSKAFCGTDMTFNRSGITSTSAPQM